MLSTIHYSASVFSRESRLVSFSKQGLQTVPDGPGIYIFLDDRGKILFIGFAGPIPGLAHRVEAQYNTGLWPEVTHFKWALTPSHERPEQIVERLVREFNPPFNRHALESAAS